jgi:uncharacterized membrane protein YoaK (UPF0700 family)
MIRQDFNGRFNASTWDLYIGWLTSFCVGAVAGALTILAVWHPGRSF